MKPAATAIGINFGLQTKNSVKMRPGGWDNELDVLAFSARTSELIHVESTWDAATWPNRKERFLTKKFCLFVVPV